MRMTWVWLGRLVPIAALALATPACSVYVTHIDHGQSYSSGNGEFDEFFEATHGLTERLDSARQDREAVLQSFASSLGASADAGYGDAILALGSRAKKLSETGILLHFVLTPEPKVMVAGGELEGKKKLESAEKAARSALKLFASGAELAAEVRGLEAKREALSGRVAEAFPDADKRQEVVSELSAAEKELAALRERAERESGGAAAFVIAMARALETGAALAPPEPPKKKPRTGGGGPPATKPKPKPSGDDFEP